VKTRRHSRMDTMRRDFITRRPGLPQLATIYSRWTDRYRRDRQSPVGSFDFHGNVQQIAAAPPESCVGEPNHFFKSSCLHGFVIHLPKLGVKAQAHTIIRRRGRGPLGRLQNVELCLVGDDAVGKVKVAEIIKKVCRNRRPVCQRQGHIRACQQHILAAGHTVRPDEYHV